MKSWWDDTVRMLAALDRNTNHLPADEIGRIRAETVGEQNEIRQARAKMSHCAACGEARNGRDWSWGSAGTWCPPCLAVLEAEPVPTDERGRAVRLPRYLLAPGEWAANGHPTTPPRPAQAERHDPDPS